MNLTVNKMAFIMPGIKRQAALDYGGLLNYYPEKFGITTLKRKAAFIAQLAHESNALLYTKEIWGPSRYQAAYEGRKDLGNIYAGDGKKFLGRGLIQITGRANYEAFGRDFFNKPDLFIKHPEKIEQPYYAVLSAVWFWWKNNLNKYADANAFAALTKKINPAKLGLNDRVQYWEKAKIALSV